MPICQKVKFSSKEYADFHINKNKHFNDAKGLTARSYLCGCGSWHITSKKAFADVKAEMDQLTATLQEDNESLREQLVDQIKVNVDLKSEVEVLKQHVNNQKQQIKNLTKNKNHGSNYQHKNNSKI